MRKFFVGLIYLLLSLLFLLPFMGIFVKSINLKMWEYVLKSSQTYESLWTTFLVVVITMLINFIIGTPLASFMARENFKGKGIIEFLIILPLIIPTASSFSDGQIVYLQRL